MWPTDMSRDECRKCLRCLELDAYGNMVSVLRAQGPFTDDKQKLLGELAKVLHISNERHRAEIRRAVNDEKLSIIAEQLNGPNTCTNWAIEGRRSIPLLPRLKAHTAFTGLANSLSLVIADANEKKSPPNKVDDPIVKAETETQEDGEQDERPTAKIPMLNSAINSRGKKRKRSVAMSSENDRCTKTQLVVFVPGETEKNSIPDNERVSSPLRNDKLHELANIVQVSIVTPSSNADTTGRNDITHESSVTQCSSTNITRRHKFTIEMSQDCQEEKTENRSNHQETPNRNTNVCPSSSIQQIVKAQCTTGAKKEGEETESHSDGTKKPVGEDTKISRPDSTTSSTPCPKRLIPNKFCITTKPVITSSTNCVVTVNSGSTASCGPGPPIVTPSTPLTYKKLSTDKLNHHSGTKMGIPLNTNKTLKINAHPNARLATKGNLIVVQKSSTHGVTLSHGGKEVVGKVIMGGKNLCLSRAKSPSVANHRGSGVPNNGEQTLAALNAESLKLGTKTGSNMLVLDIRQDVLDKNNVLSQFLDATEPLNTESKITVPTSNDNHDSITNNHNCDSSKSITKIPHGTINDSLSTLELNDKLETEECVFLSTEPADSSVITDSNEEIITIETEENIEINDIMDTQTEIYNFESTDGTIIEVEESSIPSSGIEIFSTTLASPGMKLDNFDYIDETIDIKDDETSLNGPMSTIEQLNEIDDS